MRRGRGRAEEGNAQLVWRARALPEEWGSSGRDFDVWLTAADGSPWSHAIVRSPTFRAGGPPARIEPNQLVVFGSESLGGMSATGATVVYQLADGSGSAVRAPPALPCRGGSTEIPLRFHIFAIPLSPPPPVSSCSSLPTRGYS